MMAPIIHNLPDRTLLERILLDQTRIVAEDAQKGQTVGMSLTHASQTSASRKRSLDFPEARFCQMVSRQPCLRASFPPSSSKLPSLYRASVHRMILRPHGNRYDGLQAR